MFFSVWINELMLRREDHEGGAEEVSGRVVNIVIFVLKLLSSDSISKSTSAPVDLPIQFFCIVMTSGASLL